MSKPQFMLIQGGEVSLPEPEPPVIELSDGVEPQNVTFQNAVNLIGSALAVGLALGIIDHITHGRS